MPRSRSRSFESIAHSGDDLAAAERARLLEEAVDQRGLAVVDVGDDGDVSYVTSLHENGVVLAEVGYRDQYI